MHLWAAEVPATACLAQLPVAGREKVSLPGKADGYSRYSEEQWFCEDRRSELAAHRQALLAYIMF